ncbi:MAG: MFS transporter [Bdellovibrionaceae bacterium]|nr:MFS transporter [Bdellovibrio sp.]
MKETDNPNFKSLNSTVIRLGLVSFFADVASEMLYPVTPIFLTTVLGASMASVGVIEGIAEAIASLLKTYSGSYSDSIAKRKPFIIVGYALGAISKPFIGISQTWAHVLGARALDRTGKGIRSAPRDAMIADSVQPSQRGAAFGWHRGMDTLGAATGPLLAILLLSYNSDNLRSLYFWALIPGLLSVAIIFLVKEPKPHAPRKTWQNPLAAWKHCNQSFKKYIYAWGVFSLTNSSDVFLLMKAKNSGLSTQSVIFLFCLYNLTYALSSPYLGHLSDRIDRKKIMAMGLLVYLMVYLCFGFASEAWHYWILFLIYGLYMGATEGVGKALAVDLSPAHLKATSIGILGTVTGFCTIFASVVAGFLWDQAGPAYAFIFGAFGALIAFFMILRIQRGHDTGGAPQCQAG